MRGIIVLIAIAFIAPSIYGDSKITLVPDDEVEWTNYDLTGRIVNGTKASLRQFPYQVSLRRSYNSRHFCGGSLINEIVVLTAAHCMYMGGALIEAWTIAVVAGQLELSKETSTSQKRGVEKLYVHPDFDEETLQNDVAVLVLKVPFQLTAEVRVAPMANHDPAPGIVCQVAGWGYPHENYPAVMEHLMYVDLPIVSTTVCRKLLVNHTDLFPGVFCAGYLEGQRDACQGDSGGGMVCNGLLTGVVSGGIGCARPALPGLYSSVHFFKKWIGEKANLPGYANLRNSTAGHSTAGFLLPSIFLSLALHICICIL